MATHAQKPTTRSGLIGECNEGEHEGSRLEDGDEVESEKPDGGTCEPEDGAINEEDDFEPYLKGKRKRYARETKLEAI